LSSSFFNSNLQDIPSWGASAKNGRPFSPPDLIVLLGHLSADIGLFNELTSA
jgi:hypothetical protein